MYVTVVFSVEYEKQQDPGLMTTGSYPHEGPALTALSPDGRTLALSQHADIHIYNALTGEARQTFSQVHSRKCSYKIIECKFEDICL